MWYLCAGALAKCSRVPLLQSKRHVESLSSDAVFWKVYTTPQCVTMHPGFNAICLNHIGHCVQLQQNVKWFMDENTCITRLDREEMYTIGVFLAETGMRILSGIEELSWLSRKQHHYNLSLLFSLIVTVFLVTHIFNNLSIPSFPWRSFWPSQKWNSTFSNA